MGMDMGIVTWVGTLRTCYKSVGMGAGMYVGVPTDMSRHKHAHPHVYPHVHISSIWTHVSGMHVHASIGIPAPMSTPMSTHVYTCMRMSSAMIARTAYTKEASGRYLYTRHGTISLERTVLLTVPQTVPPRSTAHNLVWLKGAAKHHVSHELGNNA